MNEKLQMHNLFLNLILNNLYINLLPYLEIVDNFLRELWIRWALELGGENVPCALGSSHMFPHRKFPQYLEYIQCESWVYVRNTNYFYYVYIYIYFARLINLWIKT